MRKKLSRILVTFVMVLCLCFGLTACKKNNDDNTDNITPAVSAKVTSISVGLAQGSAYTLTDNAITLEWGGKVSLTSSDFVITATMSDSTTKTLSLKSDSNPSGYTFASTIPSDNVTGLGEYKLTFGHDDLEQTAYKEIKVNVVKRTIDVTSLNFIWTDSSSYRYDGQAKTVEITNMANFDFFDEVTYQGNSATYPNGSTMPGTAVPISDQYDAVAIIKLKEGMDAYINLVANSDKFANDDELVNLAYQGEANTIAINHKWSIGKKIIEVPNVQMVSYVYDKNPHSVAIKNLSDFTSRKITTEIKEYVDNNLSSEPGDPTAKTNAGSYNIRINISIDATYEDKNFCELSSESNYINAIWIINPMQISTDNLLLTLGSTNYYKDTSFTYDGNEKRVYFYLGNISEYISGSNPILSYTETDTVKTNAGDYTAKITFTVNDSNYTVSNTTVSKPWKINKIDYAVSATAAKTQLTYKGNEQTLAITVKSGDADIDSNIVTYTISNNKKTNAGDYTATVQFTLANQNYNLTGCTDNKIDISWKIDKTNLAVIADSSQSFVYGITKETIATTAELAPIGGSSIEFADSESEKNQTTIYNILEQKITFEIHETDSLNSSAYTGKLNVGTYRLYPVIPNDLILENYNVVSGGTVPFNITQKPLAVTVGNKTIAYGGTFDYSLSDLTLTGLAYDDTKESVFTNYTFKYRNGDSSNDDWTTEKPTAVGEYKVKVEASSTNYTFNVTNGTLTIAKARLVVNAPTGKTFAYGTQTDDIEDDIRSGITITGFVNNEGQDTSTGSIYDTIYKGTSFEIRDSATATSAHSGEFDVGTYYIVLELNGVSVANYYIDVCDPVPMTITQYEIDVSGVALKVSGGDTYSTPFTYDATEKSVVFNLSSLKNASLIFVETWPIESNPSQSGLPSTSGEEILSYIPSGTFSATNAGTYTATITFSIIDKHQQNYKFANTTEASVTVTKTWEIAERATTPLTLKVDTTNLTFVYGTAVTLTAENVTATSLNAGDTIASLGNLGFVYSDEEDGTYTSTVPTNFGTYYVKVAEFVEDTSSGATNGFKNYSITYEASEFEIAKKQIVFTAKSQTILQGQDLPAGEVEDYSSYLVGDDTIEGLGITLTFTYTYTSSETGNTITLDYDKNHDYSGIYTIHVSASFTNPNYTNKGATNITGTLTIKQVDVYLDVVGFAKNPEVEDDDQQTASPIKVDRNSSGSQSLEINQIIKGLIVKVNDEEDTSLVATAYSDDALTQAIDFKDINSWNDVGFWIVVKKDNETIFVSEYNAYSVNFITTLVWDEYDTENITLDKLVTCTLTEAGNFAFTMPEALNSATLKQYYKTGTGSYAEGPIAVANGVNNIDYKLEIKINDVTYTYETDLQVIVSTSAQSVLSEDAGYSATFGSMNVNGNEVETSSESYNVSNINELKESIDKGNTTLNYDESKYEQTSQTSEIVGNTLLVTIVLTEKDTTDQEPEEQSSGDFGASVELYDGETKTVTIILVIKFEGWVDNDTGAVINYRNEKDESKQSIGNEITTTTNVNNFRIELNNHYATWKLKNNSTTIKSEDVGEKGELKDYWSPEAGSTWTLTITATDGTTTRDITINIVEGEKEPDIKLTIDDDAHTTLKVYGLEDGDPTGDFVCQQVMDDVNYKSIARFYAYLGSDYLKENQTTIKIASLEINPDGTLSEMLAMLMALEFNWKGTNGEDITDLEGGITLTIDKTDPDAPYAKFYIGGTFDMSEMGDMDEYDANVGEIPVEGDGAPSGEVEIAIEFYFYFYENANELEDLPDDETSIIVQMYGASITKSDFKYNKVSNTYVGTFNNLWLYQIGDKIKIERLKTSLGTADISGTYDRTETPWGVGAKIKLTGTSTDTYIVLLFLDSDKQKLDYYETKFGKLAETTFSVTIGGVTTTQNNMDYRAKQDDGPTRIFVKINKKYEGLASGEHVIKIDDISFGGKYDDGNWFLLADYDNTYVKISDMGDNKWLSVCNTSHGNAAVFYIATTKDYLENNGFNENLFTSTNGTDYRWVYEIYVVFSDSKGEGLEKPVYVYESVFAGEEDGHDVDIRLNFIAESLTDSVTANGSAYVIKDYYCIVATVSDYEDFKFTTVGTDEYITMTSFTPKTELIVFSDSNGNTIFSGSAPNCAIAYDNGYKLKVLTYTYYKDGEEKTIKYVEFYVYLSDGYNFYGYEDGYLPCYIIFNDEIPQGLFLTEDDYYKVTFNDEIPSFVTLQDADIVSQITGDDYSTLTMGNIYDNGTITDPDNKTQIDVVVKYNVTVQELETLRQASTYSLNVNVSNRLLIFDKVTLTDGGDSGNKTIITNAGQYSVTLKMQVTDEECFVSFTLTHGDNTYTFKCLFEVATASETEAE